MLARLGHCYHLGKLGMSKGIVGIYLGTVVRSN